MAKFPSASLFNYAGYDWKVVQALIDEGVSVNAVAAAADPTGLVLSKRIITIAIQKGYVFQAFYHYGVQYPLSNPGGSVDFKPSLITSGLTDNNNLTVSTGGYISSNGGSNITDMGIVWSTTSTSPTLSDTVIPTTVVASGGSFTTTISGLTGGVPIYVSSYATNLIGTAYGNVQTVTPTVLPALATVSAAEVSVGQPNNCIFVGNLTAGTSITEMGFAFSTGATPTRTTSFGNGYSSVTTTSGFFTGTSIDLSSGAFSNKTIHVRAYAINSVGTAYGNDITFITTICLVKGTKVMLSDYSYKNIEDVEYSDSLLVWNFDEGKFDVAQPLWSKIPETTNVYNWLKFSDGSELKTVSQHRIFNKEKGMFTYPMTPDTPVGTTTFNSFGEEVTLVDKKIIHGEVEYYNVITNKHINLFANTVLTSCRYNNIYPIENMKFVKDDRVLRSKEEFINIPEKYYEGLRLSEQTMPLSEIEWYVNRLIQHEKVEELA